MKKEKQEANIIIEVRVVSEGMSAEVYMYEIQVNKILICAYKHRNIKRMHVCFLNCMHTQLTDFRYLRQTS